jgi:hypothetical protein
LKRKIIPETVSFTDSSEEEYIKKNTRRKRKDSDEDYVEEFNPSSDDSMSV